MAVIVTAPQSRVLSRGACVVSWQPEFPQSRYEIQYRKKGVDSWSTLGVVTSGETSAQLDLDTFEDFQEYHYRVICYSDSAQSGDSFYSGSDASPAYSLVVCPAEAVHIMRVKYGDGMVEVPLYESAGRAPRLRQETENGVCETSLIDPGDLMASELRFRVRDRVFAAPKKSATPPDPGVPGAEDLTVDVKTPTSYNYNYLSSYSAYQYYTYRAYNYKYLSSYSAYYYYQGTSYTYFTYKTRYFNGYYAHYAYHGTYRYLAWYGAYSYKYFESTPHSDTYYTRKTGYTANYAYTTGYYSTAETGYKANYAGGTGYYYSYYRYYVKS